MATRPQLPVRIVTVYAGAINFKSTMELEQPDRIAAPLYRIVVEAFGVTFRDLVTADAALAREFRMVTELRALMGRARVVAGVLQVATLVVENVVASSLLAGVDPSSALDQLVLDLR
jgi:hypothetical protein